LLEQYVDEEIEDMEILKVSLFDDFGSPMAIVSLFGGKKQYLQVINELEYKIYKVA
jgi:type I restriction enzyme R subunit